MIIDFHMIIMAKVMNKNDIILIFIENLIEKIKVRCQPLGERSSGGHRSHKTLTIWGP